MRFGDIKVKHLYNVIFDPVRNCEFNGKHLALVLKQNNDKRTFIVMPLTSEPNGNGVNKIKLEPINSLPTSLRGNDTYAVFNQIRTVNADRFISLKEGANKIESKVDDDTFYFLLDLGIRELMFNLDQDEKISILRKMYEKECIIKAKDLAYNILRLGKSKEIEIIKSQIKEILKGIPYTLDEKYIKDGIKDIFDNILKDN